MEELSKRKRIRLENYDYSSAGAYFVTICVIDRKTLLSKVIKPATVGDGTTVCFANKDVPQTRLTPMGQIVEKYLLSSENISGVKIDNYVIMPEHIHVIIFLDPEKYINRNNYQ